MLKAPTRRVLSFVLTSTLLTTTVPLPVQAQQGARRRGGVPGPAVERSSDPWNSDAAVAKERTAAENGDARAMADLGLRYVKRQYGRYAGRRTSSDAVDKTGVRQDDAEAVRWLRRGADAGDARAMSNLAFMYQIGHGVQQSDEEAVRWYRKGAEAGYARGQANLGLMYLNGYGIPRDEAQAVRWLRAAADAGDKRASTDLGLLYLAGSGVPRDDREAFRRLDAGRSENAAEYYLGVLAANQPAFFDQYLKDKGVRPGQLKPGQMALGYFRTVLGRCTEPPNVPSYRPTGGRRPTEPPLSDSSTYRCEPLDDDMGAAQDLGDGTPRVLFDRAATQYFALNREVYPDVYRDKAALSSGEALVLMLILGGLVAAARGNGATSPDANAEALDKRRWDINDPLPCMMSGGTHSPISGCNYPRVPKDYGRHR